MSTVADAPPARGAGARWGTRVRAALVAAALVALGARVGTGEVLDALAGLSVPSVLLAFGLGAVATVASALRWRAMAAAVGVELPLPCAWSAVYRATLLNSVLPGGFLGDADRALGAHQRADTNEDAQRAARAVVLERVAGQIVVFTAALTAVATTAPALLLDPTATHGLLTATHGLLTAAGPLTTTTLTTAAGTALMLALAVAVLLAIGTRTRHIICTFTGPLRGQIAALRADLRATLRRPRTAAVVVTSSLLGFASLIATFALAARVAGTGVPLAVLLPLCTIGLVAMAIPINLGGWGPRELATAGAFAAAGIGAPTGLTISVLYGVLTLVGTLPGAAMMLIDVRAARADRADRASRAARAAASPSGVADPKQPATAQSRGGDEDYRPSVSSSVSSSPSMV